MTRDVPPRSIIIVDDHQLVRQGLRLLIGQDERLHCAGEAGDGRSAIALAGELQPDLALVDLGLPDLDGFAVISGMIAIAPLTRIIALTASLDRNDVDRALAAGARAYVVKHGSGEELLAAIHSVLADFAGIRPAMIREPAPPRQAERGPHLTERETEIVKLIAGGSHNSEIAEVLAISVLTVRKHRQNLMAKLALRNAAEIATFAIEHGLFQPRMSP